MKSVLTVGITLCVTLGLAGSASATDPDTAGIERVFTALHKTHLDKNQPGAKVLWHPKAWTANLVGGSGLTGKAAYAQGSRERWWLKPDMPKLTNLDRAGQSWLVPCLVWSERKNRAVDKVVAVVVFHKDRWVLLGAGESREQVEALAKRWDAGGTLDAPKPAAAPGK